MVETQKQKIRKIGFYGLPGFFASILASFGSLVTLPSHHYIVFWILVVCTGLLFFLSYRSLALFAKKYSIILPKPGKNPFRNIIIGIFIVCTIATALVSPSIQILLGVASAVSFWILFYLEFRGSKRDREAIAALNPAESYEVVGTYRTIWMNLRGLLIFCLVIYSIIFIIYILP